MDWLQEYSLGIVEIDNQHKRLLRQFTQIEEAFLRSLSWTDTHYLILDLIEFAKFHFEFEEALMRIFAVPSLERHGGEHRQFFVMLQEIEQHSLNKAAEGEMVEFLRSWLKNHIMGSDREYATWILSGARVFGGLPGKG